MKKFLKSTLFLAILLVLFTGMALTSIVKQQMDAYAQQYHREALLRRSERIQQWNASKGRVRDIIHGEVVEYENTAFNRARYLVKEIVGNF
jgi:hypothetical protein